MKASHLKTPLYLALFSALATMTAAAYAADGDATEDSKTTVDADVSLGSDGALDPTVDAEDKWTLDSDWYKAAFGEGFDEESRKRGIVNINGDGPIQLQGGEINISAPLNGKEQKIVFRGQSFEMTSGTFANSSNIEFTKDPKPSNPPTEGDENGAEASLAADGDGIDFSIQNGTFTNSGSITFKGYDVNVATGVTSNQPEGAAGKAEGSSVSFNGSKGSLTLDDSTLTIGTDDAAAPEYEHGKSPDEALAFGSVTLKNGSVLTNNDLGYVEKAEASEKEGEGDAEETPQDETHTRVSFGSVIVEGTSSFVSAGAGETGESLTVKFGEGAKASFTGEGLKSSWENMTLDFTQTQLNGKQEESPAAGPKLSIGSSATVNVGTLRIAGIKDGSSFDEYVDITAETDSDKAGKLAITGGLALDEFVDQGSFTISDAELTNVDLASGAGITAGHDLKVTKAEGTVQNNSPILKVEQQNNGTVIISGFKYEKIQKPVEDAARRSGDAEGSEGDQPQYEYTPRSLGSVSAFGLTKLEFADNKGQKGVSEAGKAGEDNTFHPALTVSSLTLNESWLKGTQTFELDPKDTTYFDENGELTETGRKNLIGQVDAATGFVKEEPADVAHTIKNSDMTIGTLSFAKSVQDINVNDYVKKDDEADGGESEETEKKEVKVSSDEHRQTAASLDVTGSTLEIGKLDMATGKFTASGSNIYIREIGNLSGEFSFKDGVLALNSNEAVVPKGETNDGSTTLVLGGTVALGKDANVTFGGTSGSGTTQLAGDGSSTASLTFNEGTTIEFDAKNFYGSALFTAPVEEKAQETLADADVNQGKLTLNSKVTLAPTNLAWGVYKITDGFEKQGDGTFAINKSDDNLVSEVWKDQVKGKVEIGESGTEIIVGGTTVAGSGLEDVNAVNLLNTVFGGQRGGSDDLKEVSSILNNAGSIKEIKDSLNSLVGVGVASGIAAMAVDFAGMTADQVEHHASTIPEGEGWWAMPLAGKLKSDDLAIGSTTGGYSIDATGIMGGYDVRAGQNWVVGIAGSYLTGDADSEGDILATSTDVRNYGLHLWGRKTEGNLTYTGTFSYSKTSGDATMAAFGAESSIDVLNYSAALRADLNLDMNGWLVIPHAGARISMYDFDDYQIKLDGSEVFSVTQDKVWIYEILVGVKVASDFEYQRWTVRPYADLTLRARFGDTDADYTVTATTSDTINYDVSGKFVGDLRLGWMSTFKNLNLGMSYGFSAGDAGRQNHSLEATMRVLFE